MISLKHSAAQQYLYNSTLNNSAVDCRAVLLCDSAPERQKETKWSQLKNEEDMLNKKNISSQENATETVLSKVEKEELEKKKISKGSRTRGLEVKEEMTIDEKGTVLDRKIINSDENTERFPFFETSVFRQPHHFILVQLHSKTKNS